MADDPDDRSSNPRIAAGARAMADVVAERLSRRTVLRGAFASGLPGGPAAPLAACASTRAGGAGGFDFPEIARGSDETHHVPEGYEARILLKWGDPLF